MRTLKFLMLSVALIAAPVSARGLTSPLLSRDKPHVLTVVEHAVSDTVVDTGATGDSLGDILAFGNPIFIPAIQQAGNAAGPTALAPKCGSGQEVKT